MTPEGLADCFRFGFGVGVVAFGATVGFFVLPGVLTVAGIGMVRVWRWSADMVEAWAWVRGGGK